MYHLKDRESTLKRKGIDDIKKKNRTLCPGEAAFRGEGNSRSYTHSEAAPWMQEEGRGGLLGARGILAKLFPLQPHRALQQPSYGGVEAGLGQANKQNWEPVPCAVLPSKSVCGYHPSQSCTYPKMMQHSTQRTANPWFEPPQ